ncbi:MAG: histidinol dehydrogenase [Candidatus Saganbacteria bacterium]|nr:histidinol dehydrogenase [Candidatus Saganbacteria bacterium]
MLKIIDKDKIEAEVGALGQRAAALFDLPQEKSVRDIIRNVRNKKDKALIEYTKKFDKVGLEIDEIKINEAEIKEAYNKVNSACLDAIKEAIRSIGAFHERQKISPLRVQVQGKFLGLRSLALEKVGIYIPGGRAAYPSSVLMNVIPAQIAGVPQIVLVSPPPIAPAVLVAASELGIKDIYQVGGAQAIAALAFGTETIPSVDKIVGPGNIYVMLAKKLLFGVVGIDSLAGPSDILVIADETANLDYVALDLISQAEHDPNASAILITTSEQFAQKVNNRIKDIVNNFERKKIIEASFKNNGKIFCVNSLDGAVELANLVAPEHLEIMVADPQEILDKVRNAGAIFIGPYSPVALGDYMAGPNHTLPTAGTARFSSPLTVYDFLKHQSIIGYSKDALRNDRDSAVTLAEVEGMDAHAKAFEARFDS